MRLKTTLALLTGAFALCAFPALGVANHGVPHGKGPIYTPGEPTPGPKAPLPAQAKAYGVYCRGESKQHVKGEQGTAFSRCVKAMAKAANNKDLSPGQACKGLSKKHVKGEKGTEFSRCVKAAAKLRKHQAGGTA